MLSFPIFERLGWRAGGCVSLRWLLLLSPEEYRDEVLYLSCRNIPKLVRREVPHFSVRDVLWAEDILITRAALEELEKFVAGEGGE